MAGAPDKPADPEWIHTLKHGGSFPFADSHLCSHAWASPPGHHFFVRGPLYPDIKAKVPAAEPLLQAIAFDLIKGPSPTTNFMSHPQCRVRAALHAARESAASAAKSEGGVMDEAGRVPQKPFVWVFNLQLPSKDHLSIVMYFVSFHSPEKGSLMQRFLDEDDAFRNERLKMITTIPEGPRIVKLMKAERGPGCLIGKVANCTYRREKEYMEVDINLGSSMIARASFQICHGFSLLVTTEFAFVIEGRCKSELPERIVGAMRFANLDLSLARSFDGPLLLSQEPVKKEKRKASYRGLWKYSSTLCAPEGELPAKDGDDEEEKVSNGLNKTSSL